MASYPYIASTEPVESYNLQGSTIVDDDGNVQVISGAPTQRVPADGVPGTAATAIESTIQDDEGQTHVLVGGTDDPNKTEEDRLKELEMYGLVPAHKKREDGKIELTDKMAADKLGYAFPTWKKWMILSVIFVVQVSMNFNTSVFPNAVSLIPKKYTGDAGEVWISKQGAQTTQMIFLVAYAFGSELWAPWSEEFGRWPILQLSLLLVNCSQIWGALSPRNFRSLIAARFFGGLWTAGGSVTLGMVADMFDPDDQQYAIAFIVLSSVGGTSIGPVIGGFLAGAIEENNALVWIFWTMLAFGGLTQALHFALVPETCPLVLLDREARRRRKRGDSNIYGPHELKEKRFDPKEILMVWLRPFEMFVREPIVLCLSLLSGFSDALIFVFTNSFEFVYSQWGFNTLQTGLAFIPINIGYIIGFFSFFPTIRSQRRIRAREPDLLLPEVRLWWLLFTAPLEAIGLFGFAWTSLGPQRGMAHKGSWIAPMLFSVLIAIANYAIYMATIDYMVAAYGVYSASATGGNALARDFLAGISAMYSSPMYENIGTLHLEWASTLLGCLAILVTIPVYLFYWKGAEIRARSKFAQTLAADRRNKKGGGEMGSGKDEEQPAERPTGEQAQQAAQQVEKDPQAGTNEQVSQ